MTNCLRAVLPALVLGVFAAAPAFCGVEVLGINGDAKVGPNYLDFQQYPSGSPYYTPPGVGTFQVSAPTSGILAANGVTPGETGKIASLNASVEPVGKPLIPVQFITFDTGGSNLNLFLNELLPFQLSDVPFGATVDFSFAGFWYDYNTNVSTPLTGIFSATFSGVTVAELISTVPVETPFSATISLNTSATPEPGFVLLLSVGLVGLLIAARKRIRRPLR